MTHIADMHGEVKSRRSW